LLKWKRSLDLFISYSFYEFYKVHLFLFSFSIYSFIFFLLPFLTQEPIAYENPEGMPYYPYSPENCYPVEPPCPGLERRFMRNSVRLTMAKTDRWM